jgi:hypothetical protein
VRNGIIVSLLLIISAVPSMTAGTKPKDKVILTVTATVHASAQHPGSKDEGKLDDELTTTMTETVEYNIIKNDGIGNIRLEKVSHKNRLTASGKGSLVSDSQVGGENRMDWTYSIDPESPSPQSGIAELNSGPPYRVRISLADFFRYCNGKASGTSRHVAGWDSGANAPTWETTPVTSSPFATLAEYYAFQSLEDLQLASKGQMTDLVKKLQTTYTPRKDGGFFASGSASHSYKNGGDEGIAMSSSVDVHYSVICGESPKEETEVSVKPEAGYEKWIPEGNVSEPDKPGNSLEVVLRVHAKGDPAAPREATIEVSLPNVSEQKGVCINWPKKAGAAKGLRFRKEDYEGGPLKWVDETHLKTAEAVEEVTVLVSAHDFGAWGSLRVTARDDEGRNVTVKVRGREGADLTIPLDDDGNKVADGWETDKGVEGYASTWDEATAPGQRSRGDGLTLYEKYRGVVVLDLNRGRVHTRLDPHEKAHFVIDPANIFDFDRWRRSTGVRAFRLDSSLVPGGTSWEPAASRRVDFNSEGKGEGTKFAVRIEAIKGLIEPDPPPKEDGTPSSGDAPTQYAYTAGASPGDAERVRLFPDRIRAMIDRVIEMIRAGLDPSAPDHEKQWGFLSDLGFSRDEMATRLANLDTLAREQLTDRMVALTAIHEMAHACGVKGHLNAEHKEDDQIQRDKSCPMQYLDTRARRLFVLHGELGGDGKLCSAPPDDCMGSVNVKN